MSRGETKKALKTKINVAEQLLSLNDKDELMKKIHALKLDASIELESLGRTRKRRVENLAEKTTKKKTRTLSGTAAAGNTLQQNVAWVEISDSEDSDRS